MKNAIVIALLGLALGSTRAAAQTAVEQAQILRDFQVSVLDYTQRHKCFAMFPEAIGAATPAPKVFTLPVAMLFRQLIGHALATEGPAIIGFRTAQHPVVMRPFPGSELTEFPKVLAEALPVLPAPLEYRLIGHDLVIRDTGADAIVAVLRDAIAPVTTRH